MANAARFADYAQMQAMVAQARDRWGGVHILINNAGIAGPNHPLWEYPLEAWREVVDRDPVSAGHEVSAIARSSRRAVDRIRVLGRSEAISPFKHKT